jgi:hypothetical protein
MNCSLNDVLHDAMHVLRDGRRDVNCDDLFP